MTPNNAIYRKIFEICERHTSVFDYLPNEDTNYPFLFVGAITNEDENNSDLLGVSNLSMDLYGLRVDRNTLDDIQVAIQNDLIRLNEAYNYNVKVTRLITDIRPDFTDQQPLLRVMYDIDIHYTKKER